MFSAAEVSSDFLAASSGFRLVHNIGFECLEGGLRSSIQAEVSLFVIQSMQTLWEFYLNEGNNLPVIGLLISTGFLGTWCTRGCTDLVWEMDF